MAKAMTEIQAKDSDEELKEEELEAIAGGRAIAAIYGVIRPGNVFNWVK